MLHEICKMDSDDKKIELFDLQYTTIFFFKKTPLKILIFHI